MTSKLANGEWIELVSLRNSNGVEPHIGTFGGNDGNGITLQQITVASFSQLFNEVGWDRMRGNTQGTLLASAARTAAIASSNQINYNAKGIQVILDVTAASGTGGLSLYVQGVDPVTGKFYDISPIPTAVVATGTVVYEIYPAVSGTSGNVKNRTQATIPRIFRVFVGAGDVSSYTYSVGYALIL